MSDNSLSFMDKFNLTTLLIQNASNDLWVCNDWAKNVVSYYDIKGQDFGTFSNYMMGFFSNLLSKVISL